MFYVLSLQRQTRGAIIQTDKALLRSSQQLLERTKYSERCGAAIGLGSGLYSRLKAVREGLLGERFTIVNTSELLGQIGKREVRIAYGRTCYWIATGTQGSARCSATPSARLFACVPKPALF